MGEGSQSKRLESQNGPHNHSMTSIGPPLSPSMGSRSLGPMSPAISPRGLGPLSEDSQSKRLESQNGPHNHSMTSIGPPLSPRSLAPMSPAMSPLMSPQELVHLGEDGVSVGETKLRKGKKDKKGK